jgi:hypothetical protein
VTDFITVEFVEVLAVDEELVDLELVAIADVATNEPVLVTAEFVATPEAE